MRLRDELDVIMKVNDEAQRHAKQLADAVGTPEAQGAYQRWMKRQGQWISAEVGAAVARMVRALPHAELDEYIAAHRSVLEEPIKRSNECTQSD